MEKLKCFIIDCTDNWYLRKKLIINETGECVDTCNDNPRYKYEYNGQCYENCSNGYFVDDDNSYKCKCELDKCLTCSKEALNQNLCIKCNVDYFQRKNDFINNSEFIDCFKDPKGYYLDKNESIYKKCYYRCETCEIKGDNITHNCLECNSNFSKAINFNNYSNCYENCSFYYYFDGENIYHCILNSSCPKDYSFLIEETMECVRPFPKIELEKIPTTIITPLTTIIKSITTYIKQISTIIMAQTETQKFEKNKEMKSAIDEISNKEKNRIIEKKE